VTVSMPDAADMRERCEREILTLHEFFEQWFTGAVPVDRTVFARLESALAGEFRYILPAGRMLRRQEVLDGIFDAYGAHRQARIEIRNIVWPAPPEGRLGLVVFEEHQWLGEDYDARFNTALMRYAPEAPQGVAWVHLHETRQAAKL